MSVLLDTVEIKEGATRLLVPREHSSKGPGKRIGRVFYNGQMTFNRDVSVMLFQALRIRGSALDAMAATGARGIRIANECPGDFRMVLNDRDSEAYRFIQANIELNSLSNGEATNQDLRCLLATKAYDYVDIDPFGTPAPFVQAGLQGLKRNGILAITATDTASLAGTHAKKCIRRYMARPLRNLFCHETGLRILLGYLAREAAQLDKGIQPVLCYYADHYFRCFLRVPESASAADRSLSHIGYLSFNLMTHERQVSEQAHEGCAGPLWLGPLYDSEVLASMSVHEGLDQETRCSKYLELWRGEIDMPFFYENNELASMLKQSPPVLERVIGRLNQLGHASKTHFSPTSFKTDLPLDEICQVYLAMR